MPRIIYSLCFELDHNVPGESVQLIAPLDPSGQSPFCRAVPPKQRVIDLRIGDWIRHGGKVRQIIGVAAYRDAMIAEGCERREGYVVKAAT